MPSQFRPIPRANRHEEKHVWDSSELAKFIFPRSVDMRIRNRLRNQNIQTLDELRQFTKQEMLRWPDFGAKCIRALADVTGIFADDGPLPYVNPKWVERDNKIYAARLSGRSNPDISREFHLSRERVRQIVANVHAIKTRHK